MLNTRPRMMGDESSDESSHCRAYLSHTSHISRFMGVPSVDTGGQCQARNTVLAKMLEDRSVSASPNQIEDQLVQLMNEHERPVYNFLLTLLRDPEIALDCA